MRSNKNIIKDGKIEIIILLKEVTKPSVLIYLIYYLYN